MDPNLVQIGHFTISAYGVVVALAALAGGLILARGFRERDLPSDEAWTVFLYALVAGFAGGKLYYVILQGDPSALLSRGGFVWYGGLIGGVLGGMWRVSRAGLPLSRSLDAAAPALALGHGIGHIGCFFSGDSYGLPSKLPWAVAFPHGVPPSTAANLRQTFGVSIPDWIPGDQLMTVHPTMLYSAASLLVIFGVLWALRHRQTPDGWLFALYLVAVGVERFLVEFLRAKDDRFLFGFTTAQAIALLLVATGAVLLWKSRGLGAVTKRRPGPESRRVASTRRCHSR